MLELIIIIVFLREMVMILFYFVVHYDVLPISEGIDGSDPRPPRRGKPKRCAPFDLDLRLKGPFQKATRSLCLDNNLCVHPRSCAHAHITRPPPPIEPQRREESGWNEELAFVEMNTTTTWRDTFLIIILCTPDSRSTRQGRSVVPGSESDRNDQKSQTAEVGGVVLVAAAWRLPNHEDL